MNPSFDLERYIMHHLQDSHQWHLPFLPPIQLPPFLSLHAVMLLIGAIVLIFIFCVLYDKKQRVPKGLTNLLEFFVLFIRDQIAVKAMGKDDGRRMAPFFCTLFFFILTLNLMGLVPLFSAATANVNITGGLALVTLCVMIGGAVYKNGFKGFGKALCPSGVPLAVLVILVPIEAVGLLIKTGALMIRLFANMLAGHIVILSLLGIVILLGLGALPSVLLAVAIGVLEVFIAFLQAYIFTLLSAMFIGRVYHPDH